MKRSIAAALLLWGVLWGISEATIYQYVDDQGEVHYTNELSSVPADKHNRKSGNSWAPLVAIGMTTGLIIPCFV